MMFFGQTLLTLIILNPLTTILSAPAPTPDANADPLSPSVEHPKRSQSFDTDSFQLSPKLLTRNLLTRQAGLAWGPIKIGNLKLSLTNPHNGYAGPKFPNANHVNFHVDKKDEGPRNTYSEVVNMHIVKYSRSSNGGGSWKKRNVEALETLEGRDDLEKRGGENCLYAWDSVTKVVVFDSCFDDFTDAIGEAVGAIKDFVDELLKNADLLAYIVIVAALIAALTAAIASLGVVALA